MNIFAVLMLVFISSYASMLIICRLLLISLLKLYNLLTVGVYDKDFSSGNLCLSVIS